MIEIHLYGRLRRFGPDQDSSRDSILRVAVNEGDTIATITQRLEIVPAELGRNIFLNGELSALSRRVQAGDRLGFFPPDMSLLYRQYFEVHE